MTRVLVVDDQKIPRVTVSAMLAEAGYQVAAEPGGAEALARVRAWPPDVIVLDVQMPGMDGFAVVERLKQDPETRPIPVIFLTAEAPHEALVVRGLELGAYDFLNKGCSRAELMARVGAMARIKRSWDQMAALARLSEVLVASLDPEDLAGRAAAELVRTFHARGALVLLPAGEGGTPVSAAAGDAAADARLHALGAALLACPGDGDPSAQALACAAGLGMEFGSAVFARVPRAGGAPLLAGVFAPEAAGDGDDGAARLVEVLARQTALALDNAALHQQARAAAATLREQAAALARSMEDRSRFFASMSHELRTPINAMLGYSALLIDGIYGEMAPEQRAAVERVNGSASHLLDIVNDVLDISKLDAGRLEISPEPVDIPALLRDSASAVELQAQRKGLVLRVEAPQRLQAITDPGRVRQILLNLFSNAVKFTDQGEVSATLYQPDGWAEIHVRDTGPGIAPEDHGRVFSEFEQTETATGKGGTGLGLAISRRLAVLLGGALELESAPGQGSTFILRLPRPDASPSASEVETAVGTTKV